MEELGIEHLVDVTVSMNDVTNHKPHPETAEVVLSKLMARDGSACDNAKEAAIFIGDTKFDIGCANAAGIDSVLVGWSHYVDKEALAAEGYVPTYEIDKPSDLLKLI